MTPLIERVFEKLDEMKDVKMARFLEEVMYYQFEEHKFRENVIKLLKTYMEAEK